MAADINLVTPILSMMCGNYMQLVEISMKTKIILRNGPPLGLWSSAAAVALGLC